MSRVWFLPWWWIRVQNLIHLILSLPAGTPGDCNSSVIAGTRSAGSKGVAHWPKVFRREHRVRKMTATRSKVVFPAYQRDITAGAGNELIRPARYRHWKFE